ncbi:deoxyribodipyrimidine photo-lyase [Aquiflexum balticum DSM 16537]|uniref:Cryptochrome DASH n=1 Tax=Aquiflexum balticum DSM 16537 TaxID=758820 RepID=A0A1W2GZJ1_9BACT|nr:DASH family cryptochrome [Aquiflexum balticum]SMD42031.1 deoxyribodipyrimidine photo-lyase [Aquiflexum balticum DSM 16537]
MKYNRIIVWFRNDLRVHDHASLSSSIEKGKEVVPVFCFDPRNFRELDLGISKSGSIRTKFLIESVDNLKKNLQKLGADLIIRIGKPEEKLIEMALELKADAIFFTEEVTEEEKKVENNLEKAAWGKGIETKSFWQSTLFHIEDLPFPINQIPEVFTQFRKECEKFSRVKKTIGLPTKINFPSESIDMGYIPKLSTFGLPDKPISSKSVLGFKGGEDEGKKRLLTYFWENDCLKSYKETRNGLLGADYSSKFSSWLSLGCISPRFVYEEVIRYEKGRKKNQSTYWLIFELIWRDYFRFICRKHGSKVFQIQGIKNNVDNWSKDKNLFFKWADGLTGIPFIDANMRELNQTGFMSNRGRQNVASFLVNDLGIDWRWGAAYFESMLIDYDVCSNWGNWMYIAGVGNDPRENRYFNILRQANAYDPKGEYIRHWIPEISQIPASDIHQPFELSTSDLNKLGIDLGKTYPHPIVEFKI